MPQSNEDTNKLINFAIDLDQDPTKAAEFRSDPEKFLKDVDLSENSKNLLLNSRKAFDESLAADTVVVVIAVK